MIRAIRFQKNSLLSPLAVAVLSAAIGFAQDYRARVQGTVTDATEAVIAGAQVLLRNVNTGVESLRTANASGQ